MCKSPQCLISTLTQGAEVVTYLGSRVQLCHRERGLLQTNLTGVCGELTVSGPPWVCPTHGMCAVPVYTAQAPGCSAGDLSKAGHGLHALPRSKLLRFRFSGTPQGQTRVGLCFVPFPGPSSSGDQELGEHTAPGVWCVLSPPPSQPLSFPGAQQERHLWCVLCLLWGADLWLQPSWWMPTVQDPGKTWLETGSLLTVW